MELLRRRVQQVDEKDHYIYILNLTALERLLKTFLLLLFLFFLISHCLVETDEDNLLGMMTFSRPATDSIFEAVKDIPVFNGGFFIFKSLKREREKNKTC